MVIRTAQVLADHYPESRKIGITSWESEAL